MRKITLRAKTYHDGANEERSCILRKVRSMKKDECFEVPGSTSLAALKELESWLLDRDKRYKKKAGGL